MNDVAFMTMCWERDWRIMVETRFLANKIQRCNYPFTRKILIVNNVEKRNTVTQYLQRLVKANVITSYIFVEDVAREALQFFGLHRSTAWSYTYSIPELVAVYSCKSKYLLFINGDVWLPKQQDNNGAVRWIDQAISVMKRNDHVKVASLVPNGATEPLMHNSIRISNDFYFDRGFSDQMFLVKTSDLRARVYNEPTSPVINLYYSLFPQFHGYRERFLKWLRDQRRKTNKHMIREDFEGMVGNWLRNHGYMRIVFRHNSYRHENIPKQYIWRRYRILTGYYDRC